jgi:hypothetical protein
VQHPQAPGLQVCEGVWGGRDRAGLGFAERHGDRVDGEITPQEILVEPCRHHLGKCTRVRISLAPGTRDIEGEAIDMESGRAEPLVQQGTGIEPFRQSMGIAIDDQVEIPGLQIEQQVPHCAAHHVDRSGLPEPLQQEGSRAQLSQAVNQLIR